MYSFKETERKILSFWRDNEIFEKSLEARKKGKRFVFFEGPPTANGRPGIHHFLGRAFKDIFCRYKSMQGFFVLRKAGWDTHGLPVEIEVEKELGLKNKKAIEEYGIGKFNKKAKESVWKYKTEWEDMTKKMGFWVDLDDPYITYENNYIESVWNIIQQIWKKKLLYQAHKVVPFCTRCGTSLSSHEVAQGYKKVKDNSVYIKFKIKNLEVYKLPKNSFILAWTTTPWTLPGNVALAVGKDVEYLIVEKNGEHYILARDLVERVLGSDTKYKILDTKYKGSDLVGLEYEPLFDIPELKSETSYKIYEADFVSTDEGTGVVHTAVMYGEDDYNLGTKVGLPKYHTVDEQGKFVGVSKELDGKYVKSKETEKLVIRQLEIRNLLLKVEDFEHEYPFCWRCDSPLVYYAKSSWFIKMSAVNKEILKNNDKINWFPEHLKEGRFGQWLKEGKDWAFSRERYWGTPLPIWFCGQNQIEKLEFQNSNFETNSKFKIQNSKLRHECGNIKVIGSIEELEKYAIKTKKNTYFTLRHGYTARDEKGKGIISSNLESDVYYLTDEGKKQVQKTAEFIKNNHEIDLIFSSPFLRTHESAEIVGKLIHKKVHKDERIREIKHGGCEGESHLACPVSDLRKTIDDRPHEFSETWNEVRTRMADFISEMESKYSGKNILIVSHGDPIWILDGVAKGATGEELTETPRGGKFYYPKVAGFTKVEWRNIPRNNGGELDLHRPFIDSISLECDSCGASMKKVPDLIDVWFDSGSMPFAQWHWPFKNKKEKGKGKNREEDSGEMFKEQFPADFIAEGVDQTRGWFYTLLAISTLLGKGVPYKNVLSYGHVLDDKGKKMSKSKGNVVSPFEVIDKVGADTARWYFYTINQPGEYKNFSLKDLESKLKGFISTLENCVRFYELYSGSKIQYTIYNIQDTNLLDKWILSKLNGLVAEVSVKLDEYDPTTAARLIEKFVVEDLSNWWLRRSRKRKEALGLLRFLLLDLSKLLAPFMPFMAEEICRRLQTTDHRLQLESIHLCDWPKADKKLIDKKIEEEMKQVQHIVTAGLALRKESQIKVRQPLTKLALGSHQPSAISHQLLDLIKEEVNVKEVVFDESQKEEVVLATELTHELIQEGHARELIRQIQDMRKEAKYKLDEKVYCQWHSEDKDLSDAINKWSDEIKKEALLSDFMNRQKTHKTYDVEKEFNLAPEKVVWIGIKN